MSFDTPSVPKLAAYSKAMGDFIAPDKISGMRLSRLVTGGDFDFGRRHWNARNRSWKRYRRTRWKINHRGPKEIVDMGLETG